MAFIKLNAKAYAHNLAQVASKAGGIERVVCVFKNNAYGHGVNLLAPLAKAFGVKFIALKNEREALEIENFFQFLNANLRDFDEKFFLNSNLNQIDKLSEFDKKLSENFNQKPQDPAREFLDFVSEPSRLEILNQINEKYQKYGLCGALNADLNLNSSADLKSNLNATLNSKTPPNASFETILILSHIPNGKENARFTYAANDIKSLGDFKKGSKLHLVIDTGMHRNGVLPKDIAKAYEKARALGLEITGVFTHFAGSDELDASFFVQREKFNAAKKLALKAALKFGFQAPIFHASNSAALFRSRSIPTDELCRVGLAQFGYNDFNTGLKKVLSLYAQRLSSRTLQSHESLGYGGVFSARKRLKIATYDLGYADGLFRYDGGVSFHLNDNFENASSKDEPLQENFYQGLNLASKSRTASKLVLANGKSLLGRMSMDSFSCEDSGASVCVFKDANLWASYFHTINYEILSKLSPHILRILF